MDPTKRLVRCLFWLMSFAVVATSELEAAEILPDFVMYRDPDLPEPVVIKQLDATLLPLWRQVLVRPESDYQRLAAEAIAEAAEDGYPDLEPAIDELLRGLSADETRPSARFAAARALIALDVRSSADTLFAVSQQHDFHLRLLVEPTLAAWKFEAILPVWQERIRDPLTNRRELKLALDGVAAMQDATVLESLLDIVHSADRPSDIRFAAAVAAGAVANNGLEPAAERLLGLQQVQSLHQLCAVSLLSRHTSETAQSLLTQLAQSEEPTVVERALGCLLAIDPQLVIPLAEGAMQNVDPKVRRRGADGYVALPTSDRIASLSHLLNDLHPDVRTSIRDDMVILARQSEFDEVVRATAFEVLAGDNWRGQEQAAILLGALDHEPAADRLLELLSSPRSEVMIAAAWSLKVLAIPETLPAVFEHAQFQTVERRAGRATDGLDQQVAHLFEMMAQMNHAPVDAMLREYVPKSRVNGYFSRGAAIWGLGLLHAGAPDEGLAAQLVERMNDTADPFNPEMDIVFIMSAVSLGRMQVESQLSALRGRLEATHPHDPVSYAIRWSIHEITGEEFPELDPVIRGRAGWFLEPLAGEDSQAP